MGALQAPGAEASVRSGELQWDGMGGEARDLWLSEWALEQQSKMGAQASK